VGTKTLAEMMRHLLLKEVQDTHIHDVSV